MRAIMTVQISKELLNKHLKIDYFRYTDSSKQVITVKCSFKKS